MIFLSSYLNWSPPEQMYKLFPSTVASLTRKNPEDKREPRLQKVFFTDDELWWQLQTWFCGWWQCLQQWWWRPKLQVCDDKSLEKAGPLIVVNLMKIKDPEALAKWVLSYEKVAPLIVINWMKISLLKFPLLSSLAFSLYHISWKQGLQKLWHLCGSLLDDKTVRPYSVNFPFATFVPKSK